MQKANYTVSSGSGVALWRGIPAQIDAIFAALEA